MKTLRKSAPRDLRTALYRIAFGRSARTDRGFSLLMVMFLIALGFLLMTGILRYSGGNSTATERYNEYYRTLAAAEASTEKVIGQIAHYFQYFGVAGVDSQLTNIGNVYPVVADGWGNDWGSYDFMNPLGGNNSTYVAKLSNEQFTGLNWKYPGFSGYAASYRIISNVRRVSSGNNIVAALRQDVQVASIPLFEFGVFYALEMEINPSQDMTLTGRVHCNTNIYAAPSNPRIVTFAGDVTSAHQILRQPHPDDGPRTPPFNVNFLGAQDWNIASLKLPIGTPNPTNPAAANILAPNTPDVLREIINIPPSGEGATTLLGRQRYYNKADLIIVVTNGAVIATGNAYNGFAPVPWATISSFVNTNVYYVSGGSTNRPVSKRESMDLLLTEIDIQQFNIQSNALWSVLSRYPTNLYVADVRTQPANTQSGVRLINGQTLPNVGLTFATMNPLYVQGHYNAPAADLGTTNTSATRPASLIADAITVLSGNWNDANSTNNAVSARSATDTTINAAIVAGIVPTDTEYSGGVENFIRLLEDWGGRTLTFNGSIVVLYESQIAIAPWGGPNVYSPPATRRYGFDGNFKEAAKLPAGTPYLRSLIRGEWVITQANSSF